jgi:hypothetical protein
MNEAEKNCGKFPKLFVNSRSKTRGDMPDRKTIRQPGESLEDYMKRWNEENKLERTVYIRGAATGRI